MIHLQIAVFEISIAFAGAGIYMLAIERQVMTALFFAVVSVAFAILFVGLRVHEIDK